MNKNTKIVAIGALAMITGSAFLQFDFIPIGATLMGLGGFAIWFGPLLIDLDEE